MAIKRKTSSLKGSASFNESSWFDRFAPQKKDWFCISIIALITIILFWSIIFEGKIFSVSGDAAAFNAWEKGMNSIRESEKITDVFWVPYVFSGIPIFSTLLIPNDVNYIEKILIRLPIEAMASNPGEVRDVFHIFLAGLFMFFLARSMHFSHLVSLLGSLVLMLNPYAIGALQAHQGSKIHALSLIPLLFLLVYQLLQNLNGEKLLHWKNLLYFGGLSAVTGWLLLTSHVQIIFYGLLLVGAYLLYEVIVNIKNKPLLNFRNVMIVGIALLLGLAVSAYLYLPTQEYAQYSIRGGGGAGETGGLNYEYATGWSFHPFEIMNYILPSFFGFESPFYWGWMPFTESTVYIGVVPILLVIMALIYRRNKLTWFLVIFSTLMFFISFGKHLGLIYNLMFDYFPYFNKFRVPVLILHLIPITFGMLAAIGLSFFAGLHQNPKTVNLEKLRKGLMISLGVIGTIFIIGLAANDTVYSALSGSMFQRADDLAQLRQQYGAQAPQALEQLKRMRFDLLWKDYIKFAVIAGISLSLLLAFVKRKVTFTNLTAGFIVILLIDLLVLDTKFINPQPKTAKTDYFVPDATVQFLQTDTTDFRIYPVGRDFQDNNWMYHKVHSVGGYSPAKLKIYQEMIDSTGLYPPKLPLNMNLLSMLSVKYVIVPGQLPATDMNIVNVDNAKQMITYQNPNVLPRAFFADGFSVKSSKTEIFAVLNSTGWNPKGIAVLEKYPPENPVKSESTYVRFVKDWSQDVELDVFCSGQSLLVLSDAYYPAGWKAYVDGSEKEIYKANYVVRAVVVPPGKHKVEFVYSPTSTYRMGYAISNAAHILAFVILIAGIAMTPWFRNKFGRKGTDKTPLESGV